MKPASVSQDISLIASQGLFLGCKKTNMLHIDLFSGIGGFAYAADTVFGKSDHVFVEISPFCKRVLSKLWPTHPIYEDIKQFSKQRVIADAGGKKSHRVYQKSRKKSSEVGNAFILTGGFPCQPFSQAGRRKGTKDDRYLWPEMLRVIKEWHPQWIIAENVRGLATWNNGMVLETVCSDLERQGYEVQAFIIPAVGVGASHRRERIWFIACNSKHSRLERHAWTKHKEKRRQKPFGSSVTPSWSRHWLEVATKLCRMDDGLPAELDGLKLSKPAHRNERLKSLGNAIVPQVAMEIMRAIKATTN